MKGKKQVAALAAIVAVAGIGGTFAYFNQTLTAHNTFDTGKYDTELVEKFKPSDGENWEPGSEVNKDVTVQNTGTLPVVVRVKFEEIWERERDKEKETIYQMDTTKNKDKIAVGTPSEARNKFENVYQGDPDDGLASVDADDSVVFKKMIPDGGWVYNSADGYYYYQQVLPGIKTDETTGKETIAETTKLLDSVTLAENADMGRYKETKYYALTEERPQDSGNWIEFEKIDEEYLSTREMNAQLKAENKGEITYMKSVTEQLEGLKGYSEADYTLIVTAQTVQATAKAVESAFGKLDLNALGLNWTLISED